ncbi:MAG: hypothetical protein J6Y43_03150 [Clostridia bacterium]|nr:hypothetical protein [Clostridia bacterium]
MAEKNVKRKKSVLILALIATVSFLIAVAAGIGIFAVYTNTQSVQRTIATYDVQGERFSSNILKKGDSKDNIKTIYVANAENAPSAVITVCNYERGKQTKPFAKEINYSVVVRFVKYDASAQEKYVPVDAEYMTENSYTGYSATLKKDETTITLSSSHLTDDSFSGTLTADQTDSDAYTLTFGTNFAVNQPNLYVEMTVSPNAAELPVIRGIFKTGVSAHGAANLWAGAFSDDTDTPPSGYHGFNYVVEGVGEGTVNITWDDTKVSLNDYSLLMLNGATREGSSITFNVDSDVSARHELMFNVVRITAETWSVMNSTVVRFTFVG